MAFASAPTPRLKDARSAEHGARITRERVELFDRFAELLVGGEVVVQYGSGDVLQSDTSEKFYPALERCGVNQLHLDILESGLA